MRPLSQPLNELLPAEVILLTHAPILESRIITWPDEAACAAFAQRLSGKPELREAYIELHGALGAGKTTLVRHLLRALGVQGRIKSPTYAVVEIYHQDGLQISHFDFYRFENAREWDDAGLRDLFAEPGLKLAEWPQKAAEALPQPDLRLLITVQDEHLRQVEQQACSPRGVALLS